MFQQIPRQAAKIPPLDDDSGNELNASPRISLYHCARNLVQNLSFGQSKNILQHLFINRGLADFVTRWFGKREHLLEQRLGITHAAVRLSSQKNQSSIRDLQSFLVGYIRQSLDDLS